MRRVLACLLLLLCTGCALHRPSEPAAPLRRPVRWFEQQRTSAGPIPPMARSRAIARAQEAGILVDAPGSWANVGPRNVGGRVTAIDVDPNDPDHLWIGTADGGVFTSFDEGATWTPVFDDQVTLSIGAVATHPTNSSVVYVGTGEDNGGGFSYDGEGVFKTTDGGATWTNVGLGETRRIGRIAIHPAQPERVFVAAGGDWYHKDVHRGVYRSLDGGASWQKVLYVADDAGAIDIAIDPADPQRLYAAIWQRHSFGTSWYIGGTQSGIWRSLDGGTTWTRLTVGLPTTAMGRIGLAVAPSNTAVVYAVIIGPSGSLAGVYRSTNRGDSWAKTSNSIAPLLFSTYSYYFGTVEVDPDDANVIYCLDVNLLRSTNGGSGFNPIATPVHVDWHALEVEPGGRWLGGTDGGFYRSADDGVTWTHAETLPITQLYDLGIDRGDPARRFAGAQDNGTNRTTTGGTSDWTNVLGGDGLQCEVDYLNGSNVVASSQFGNFARSTDGGTTFVSAVAGIDPSERTNWNAPLVLDPVVPSTLYTATTRVYRSIDGAQNWTPISPDLTNGPTQEHEEPQLPANWKTSETLQAHLQNLIEGTITVVAVSPVDVSVLWAGTDDGNVWVSTNGGGAWSPVNPPGTAYWVTDLEADPFDRETAYLTVTGYREGDDLPYVRVTHDLGATWADLSAGLPQVPMNTIRPDTTWRGRLFLGSDIGVHVSDDAGATWSVMRGEMPWIVVMDLVLHEPSDTLYAGTHARSIFTYDLTQLPPADGDGDGVDNNTDCAMLDGGAFAAPGEVPGLSVDRAGADAVLSWTSLAGQAGTGTVYDLASGAISSLAVSGTGTSGSLACAVAATTYTDFTTLLPDTGVYYLVRARNVCGIGGWGRGSDGVERSSGACP